MNKSILLVLCLLTLVSCKPESEGDVTYRLPTGSVAQFWSDKTYGFQLFDSVDLTNATQVTINNARLLLPGQQPQASNCVFSTPGFETIQNTYSIEGKFELSYVSGEYEVCKQFLPNVRVFHYGFEGRPEEYLRFNGFLFKD